MSKIKFELAITGMHCAACSSRIEQVVSKMAEVGLGECQFAD